MNEAIVGERVLARQFARELTMEEVTMVGGQVKQTCDAGDYTGSTCSASDGNSCDLDQMNML